MTLEIAGMDLAGRRQAETSTLVGVMAYRSAMMVHDA